MLLGRSCKFYENSRCLLKGFFCDLSCCQMGSYGDESYELVEEVSCTEEMRPFV